MNLPTLIIGSLVLAAVLTVVIRGIRNVKNHNSGCGCGCSGCPNSHNCHPGS